MSTEGDTVNFFRSADYNEEYWNNYLAARPLYDQEFYQSIYEYHKTRNNAFGIAHDVGTGPGHVAARLAARFEQVIASDNNETHLAVARHRLGPLERSKVKLLQCPAESLADRFDSETADLVVAAECLPLLDVDVALRNFSHILKPNGTLAVWFYGRPAFAEPEYAQQCQSIYDSIIDMSFSKFIKGGGPQHKAGWKRATDHMSSFLDNVDMVSTNLWTDIRRVKWNSEHPMSFYGPDACDFDVQISSKIDEEKEKVTEIKSPQFWERRWDLEGVKRFVAQNLPTFDKANIIDEKIEEKYEELAKAMGGHDAVRKITWPVVLILARKNDPLKSRM